MDETTSGLPALHRAGSTHRLADPDFFNLNICPMKKNMGSTDQIIRIILAVVFAALYFTGTVTGTAGLILLVLGAVFVGTSLVRFCPLYAIVGLSTCPVAERK